MRTRRLHRTGASLLTLLFLLTALAVASGLGAAPAHANGYSDFGVSGAYRGGLVQDTADAVDPLRLDTGDAGGFLVQGTVYWDSPQPPAASGPAAELVLHASGEHSDVTLKAGYSRAWKGLYYYAAPLRDSGFQLDVDYQPQNLAAGAVVNAAAVFDGADAPREYVQLGGHLQPVPLQGYREQLEALPAPAPTTGRAYLGAIRPTGTAASASYLNQAGAVTGSVDLTGKTNIADSMPVSRGADDTVGELKLTPDSTEMMWLYSAVSYPAPHADPTGTLQLVRRGSYTPVTSAAPGEELDLLATVSNAAGSAEPMPSLWLLPVSPGPTGLGIGPDWVTDPASSAGVQGTPTYATGITVPSLAPGQTFVARIPATVQVGAGAGSISDLSATVQYSWEDRFLQGNDARTLIISADLLPNAKPTLEITPGGSTWVGDHTVEQTYTVGFNNLTGPDALTSGTVTLAPSPGASVTAVDPVGGIACADTTCDLTEPLPAGHGTTLTVTVHAPAPGIPGLTGTATWAPNPTGMQPLTAAADQSVTDTTAPMVHAPGTAAFTTSRTVRIPWDSSDAESGLQRHELQWRTAARPDGPVSKWHTEILDAATTAITRRLATGEDYCYRIRAVDRAGNTSPWTPPQCVARLLDDRALTASRGWQRTRSSLLWNHTGTMTKTAGKTLTVPASDAARIAVLATTCPTCGKVTVTVGARKVGTVSLYSVRTHRRRLIELSTLRRPVTGTARVKVISRGKRVEIDGIGIARQ